MFNVKELNVRSGASLFLSTELTLSIMKWILVLLGHEDLKD